MAAFFKKLKSYSDFIVVTALQKSQENSPYPSRAAMFRETLDVPIGGNNHKFSLPIYRYMR
jgi:hypothetical protein